jgi:hypothetical protein
MNTKWHPGMTPTEREKRDGHIRELYAMGWTKQELAERYDITPQRVHQIVRKP